MHRAREAGRPEERAGPVARAPAGANGMRRVLIATDDAELRGTIANYLGRHGFETVEAGNGLETLLRVERGKPDVVLLDLVMPRLAGLDALARIRRFDPGIFVVVVTGANDPELRQRSLALGAATVLTKPLELPGLLMALDGPCAVRSEDAPDGEPPPHSAAPPGPADTSEGQVLIVDDDPDVSAVIEEFLRYHGYRTRSVPDGASALHAVIDDAPDVILLDIEMPGLGGVEALLGLRSLAARTRIIMVSGSMSLESSQRALALGAFDYVPKPVDFTYLLQSLETAVTLKRLES